MRKSVVGLAVALAASLAVNGYLVWRTPAPASSAPPAAAREAPGARLVAPMPPAASPAARATARAAEARAHYAELDRTRLEDRLAAAEARIEQLLPLDERFSRHDREPAYEAEVAPLVDRAFELAPGAARPYQLACRGAVCRIAAERGPWRERIQADGDAGRFASMQFGDDVYLEVDETDQAARNLLRTRVRAAHAAVRTTIAACIDAPGARLTATVQLDANRHLRVSVAGAPSLAIDSCVTHALEAALAEVAIPTDVDATTRLTLPVP